MELIWNKNSKRTEQAIFENWEILVSTEPFTYDDQDYGFGPPPGKYGWRVSNSKENKLNSHNHFEKSQEEARQQAILYIEKTVQKIKEALV